MVTPSINYQPSVGIASTFLYTRKETAMSTGFAMCMRETDDVMCGGGVWWRPKGGGGMTTSRRYSREKHRQSDTFYQTPWAIVTLQVSLTN